MSGQRTASGYHWAHARSADRRLVRLEKGQDVFATLFALAERLGVRSAGVQFVSGSFERLELMTGGPPKSTESLYGDFYGPHKIRCPAILVGGTGILGLDSEQDTAFLHIHAVFCDAEANLRGCHLFEGGAIVGEHGAELVVLPVEESIFRKQVDPRTEFEIFFPVSD